MISPESKQDVLTAVKTLEEALKEGIPSTISPAVALQLTTLVRVLAQEVAELENQVQEQGDRLRNLEAQLETQYTFCCGTGNVPLAQKVADLLGCELDNTMEPTLENPTLRVFQGVEFKPIIRDTLRGKVAILFQSPSPAYEYPPGSGKRTYGINGEIIQVQLMIDACVKADAKEIILVMPRMPYARQDRKKSGEPISSAQLLQTFAFQGASHFFCLDLHAQQSMGTVNKPFDAPYSSYALVPWIQNYLVQEKISPEDIMFLAPDNGGVAMNTRYSQMALGANRTDVAMISKSRNTVTGKTKVNAITGDVDGKIVIIVDDEVGSAGTLCQAAKQAYDSGAIKVIALGVHGLLHPGEDGQPGALERIRQSRIDLLVTTDTIDHRPEVLAAADDPNSKLKIVTVAPLIAAVIQKILSGDRTSDLIIPTNSDFPPVTT